MNDTLKVCPKQVFQNVLEDIRFDIEVTRWTKDLARRKELKILAKRIRRDMKGLR